MARNPCRRCNRANPREQRKNMFDSTSFIVGLEIGTSKICAVVGEINSTNTLTIVGVGQARSRGVRKGEIADAAAAEEDVRNAIVEAERMADVSPEVRAERFALATGFILRAVADRARVLGRRGRRGREPPERRASRAKPPETEAGEQCAGRERGLLQ